MIKFETIQLNDKNIYEKLLHNNTEHGCEYSFSNLFMWGTQKIAFLENHVLLFSSFDSHCFCPFPVGCGNKKDVLEAIFKETGSLGIRISPNIHRGISKREFVTKEYEINGQKYEVTFKVGYVNGEVISSRPEYEDLKRIAKDSGLALRDVKELIK